MMNLLRRNTNNLKNLVVAKYLIYTTVLSLLLLSNGQCGMNCQSIELWYFNEYRTVLHLVVNTAVQEYNSVTLSSQYSGTGI